MGIDHLLFLLLFVALFGSAVVVVLSTTAAAAATATTRSLFRIHGDGHQRVLPCWLFLPRSSASPSLSSVVVAAARSPTVKVEYDDTLVVVTTVARSRFHLRIPADAPSFATLVLLLLLLLLLPLMDPQSCIKSWTRSMGATDVLARAPA